MLVISAKSFFVIVLLDVITTSLGGKLRVSSSPNATARGAPALIKALLGFQLLPNGTQKEPFVTECSDAVSKRLPAMAQAYTARLVPHVIMHQCSIYVTKLHYQVKGGSIERAEYDCNAFGEKLVKAFEGDKNYKPWCDEVYVYLTTGDYTDDAKEQARLLKERNKIRAELKELKRLYAKEHNQSDYNQKEFECPLPCYPNPKKHRPLTGEARDLEVELKSLQKDLGMTNSLQDDLARLAKTDGDFDDKDAELLDGALDKLDKGVEKHDSDEDNVAKLESEIHVLRDDITSSKHEFPKELEDELREAKLLRYGEEIKFDDQSADALNRELRGMEKELGANKTDTFLKAKIPDIINCSNITTLNQSAAVVFTTASCCPSDCKICGRSSAFLTRDRHVEAISGSVLHGVDLFHSLIRDFAQHKAGNTFEASCLQLVGSTFQSGSVTLAELQRECELYAGGDADEDDDDSGKETSAKFPNVKAHCMHFAEELAVDHTDATKKAGWCHRVHAYLEGKKHPAGELPTIYHVKRHGGCCPSGCRTCKH
eukprot:gnl/MRDRNA2_/MRDRNA2_92738_c0_seq1.p1 gnl/MRDRNA2_/MRDRNA2_92738_c0~~gnl/MRDRNA2_/MRDRNA2_92738_c0_seq1.p1  ORF type:complete len:542 (+),score=121.05 gnl/MRDRNA2_/MRDRNA2_92738_c0_seq1:132-1757(+)